MTALSADKARHVKGSPIGVAPMDVAASEIIYQGAIVANNTSGDVVAAADTAGYTLAGIASEQVDNSGGSAGDKTVSPQVGHVERLAISGSTLDATDIGKDCAALDDQTVRDVTGATNNVKVGTVVAIEDSEAWVWIGVMSGTDS